MPAAGQILVTFASMTQAQADTTATANNLNQQLADLKAYLQPMVATWIGGAATEYQARQAEWDQAQQELNEILARIGLALGQAHDNYLSTEQVNEGMWA